MLLSLDGVWSQWMTLVVAGAVVTSLLLVAACAVSGLCAEGRDGSQRKAL